LKLPADDAIQDALNILCELKPLEKPNNITTENNLFKKNGKRHQKTKISYREALKQGLRPCKMTNAFLMGKTMGRYGAFAVSKGFLEFGEERIMDVPLSEAGLWVRNWRRNGMKPVEVMTVNF
jgi:hypothetical protein